jgi:acyl-CoA dehydrogenase family protein 9
MRGASAVAVSFDGARVAPDQVLGEPGRGFQIAMSVLSSARLSLAACCLGSCRALTRLSVDHARERKTFGRPLAEFGAIKSKVARMLAQTYALESTIYLTGGLVDARTPDTAIEVAICKVLGSETLWEIAHEALQIAGAAGYVAEQPYERMLRDARAYALLEGPNEVLRCFIALAGMASPGERVAEVARAMREPIKGIGLLRDFALRKARSMIVPERMSRAHPLLGREAVLLEEGTAQLARHVEIALRRHGERIAEMQLVQHRVADVAIMLYALSACLARTTQAVEQQGEERARRAADFTRIFAALARERLRRCFEQFESNDDELRKDCAVRGYDDRGYPLDVL